MSASRSAGPRRVPSERQAAWLRRGLRQGGGKLPLFDEHGQRVNPQTIRCCLENGWAERWFANPLKPDWLVCRLTEAGRRAVTTPVPAEAEAETAP